MTEHIQSRGRVYCRGHSTCIQRVANTEGRFKDTVGNTCFSFFRGQIEDSSARRFRAGSGSGRDGYKRKKGFVNGETSAEGRVDKV